MTEYIVPVSFWCPVTAPAGGLLDFCRCTLAPGLHFKYWKLVVGCSCPPNGYHALPCLPWKMV